MDGILRKERLIIYVEVTRQILSLEVIHDQPIFPKERLTYVEIARQLLRVAYVWFRLLASVCVVSSPKIK